MISRLTDKKFVLIFLGFMTAILLSAALIEGINLNSPHFALNDTGDLLGILYIVIPVVLLTLGIVRFRMTRDPRLLTYTISVVSSVVIVIPLLFIAFIVIFVGLFGFMPQAS